MLSAVKARDAAKVKELLQQDPTLAEMDTEDGTILMTAIYYGARECVGLIREAKPSLNLEEGVGVNDVARVRELLQARPEAAAEYQPDGSTLLHLAAYMNRREIAALLLDHRAGVSAMALSEAPNIPANTPLHAALAGTAWETAELLLDRGADIHAVDSIGGTPLHNAAARPNAAMVRRLLEMGAEVNCRNKAGLTPLGLAVARKHDEVAAVLREFGGAE